MADLAMKTSGATKAAVRTVEPPTNYAIRKGEEKFLCSQDILVRQTKR